MNDLERQVLEMYRNGSKIEEIIKSLNITHRKVKQILLDFKNKNKLKKAFTDEFKKVIAERDLNGISRRQIALELEINASTVRKACEKFGQTLKEKPINDENKLFTRIDGKFNKDKCPKCKNNGVNEVDINTIYCKNCGNEFIIKKDHILMINWEYID